MLITSLIIDKRGFVVNWRSSKVANLRVKVFIEEDVVIGDIPIYYISGMDKSDRGRNLFNLVESLQKRNGFVLFRKVLSYRTVTGIL